LIIWFWVWDHRFMSCVLGLQTPRKMFGMLMMSICIVVSLFGYVTYHTYWSRFRQSHTEGLMLDYYPKQVLVQSCTQLGDLGRLMTWQMTLLLFNIWLSVAALMKTIKHP